MTSRAVLRCGDRELALGSRTFIMGIVNVTPDSFSGDGKHDVDAALAHALAQLDAGADIIDVGGESTRPNAAVVDEAEERARVLPVIEALVKRGPRAISVDTRRASVARDALAAGASWINDVSALADDPAMPEVATRADAVVLMHRRAFADDGTGRGDRVKYGDVVGEVHAFLAKRVNLAVAAGIEPARIVVDPGLGFGKNVDDNVTLLKASGRFSSLGAVLVGPSRKRFIGALSGVDDAAQRGAGTLGAVACAIMHGADIVRVHDVKAGLECARVVDAVVRQR